MIVEDLNQMPYRLAWQRQDQAHADVLAGGPARLLLVEHAPVITFGRRPGVARHLIASEQRLAEMGVELVQSDRGGDITFHGPGQLVAYPIVRLIDHGLSVGAYVRRLLDAVVETLTQFGIHGQLDPSAIGVWAPINGSNETGKICALGVRIRRGVSMHGIALNVTTDLRYFNLIVPCGLAGRRVVSMQQILGDATPPMGAVKEALVGQIKRAFEPIHHGRHATE